ncbi:hypothetical protein VP1G_00112 [Cytospora mali]|uniref:RING-type domain-containing protein n=1 Tax=Cytospora mali TaxID=578113 RepID=A0A194ULP1_CYTMA|nr:hypothetical protein VP1G_00112 [Valsa mali var. pyri (nom. inval.)]
MLGRLQLPSGQIYAYNYHNSTSTSLSFCTASAIAFLIYPSLFPLVSPTETASLLHYLFHYTLFFPTSRLPNTMKPVKLKSPVKTSVARHDEQPDRHHDLDPACAICQVDVGTKSPDGVKETWSITPCGHIFGSVCIKRYLAITDKPLCPVCRNDLFHMCSHPVLPASYDPKKLLQSRDEAAQKAFPAGEPRHSECQFCRKQRLKLEKRQRMLEMLEGPPPPAAAAAAAEEERGEEGEEGRDGDSSGESDNEEGARTPRTKGLRWALHLAFTLARLTLDATRIRKIKALHPEDDDEGEIDDVVADSPQLPATSTRDLPPVPGLYGYWDVARKGPDWKFLAWFDSQEPKTKTTADHFS